MSFAKTKQTAHDLFEEASFIRHISRNSGCFGRYLEGLGCRGPTMKLVAKLS